MKVHSPIAIDWDGHGAIQEGTEKKRRRKDSIVPVGDVDGDMGMEGTRVKRGKKVKFEIQDLDQDQHQAVLGDPTQMRDPCINAEVDRPKDTEAGMVGLAEGTQSLLVEVERTKSTMTKESPVGYSSNIPTDIGALPSSLLPALPAHLAPQLPLVPLIPDTKTTKRYGCPVHLLPTSDAEHFGDGDSETDNRSQGQGLDRTRLQTCHARFWRVYHLQRHLKSDHGVEMETGEIKALVGLGSG